MSMSSPSIIIYQSLRCTKVPRRSVAAASSSTVAAEPTPAVIVAVSGSKSADGANKQVTPVAAFSDGQTTVVPTTSYLSSATDLASPKSDSDSELHRPIPSPTSHNQASGLSSPSVSSDLSSSEVLTTSTIETGFILGTPTAQIATAAFPSATEPSLGSSDGQSEDASHTHRLRTILGSALGVVVFVGLLFLICFLIFRYKRRKSRDNQSFGGSEKKLLHSGRQSADSWTSSHHAFPSKTHSLSDASSVPSLNPLLSPATSPVYGHHARDGSYHFLNPFSDPSGSPCDPHPHHTHDLSGAGQGPLPRDGRSNEQVTMEQTLSSEGVLLAGLQPALYEQFKSPAFPIQHDQRSIYSSERSLGSTIILPGRSSIGSSVRRTSYQISISDLAPLGPNESVTRVSTRSDPFDLEVPPNAMHKRNSSVLPSV